VPGSEAASWPNPASESIPTVLTCMPAIEVTAQCQKVQEIQPMAAANVLLTPALTCTRLRTKTLRFSLATSQPYMPTGFQVSTHFSLQVGNPPSRGAKQTLARGDVGKVLRYTATFPKCCFQTTGTARLFRVFEVARPPTSSFTAFTLRWATIRSEFVIKSTRWSPTQAATKSFLGCAFTNDRV
jgi:hypothetical protein